MTTLLEFNTRAKGFKPKTDRIPVEGALLKAYLKLFKPGEIVGMDEHYLFNKDETGYYLEEITT